MSFQTPCTDANVFARFKNISIDDNDTNLTEDELKDCAEWKYTFFNVNPQHCLIPLKYDQDAIKLLEVSFDTLKNFHINQLNLKHPEFLSKFKSCQPYKLNAVQPNLFFGVNYFKYKNEGFIPICLQQHIKNCFVAYTPIAVTKDAYMCFCTVTIHKRKDVEHHYHFIIHPAWLWVITTKSSKTNELERILRKSTKDYKLFLTLGQPISYFRLKILGDLIQVDSPHDDSRLNAFINAIVEQSSKINFNDVILSKNVVTDWNINTTQSFEFVPKSNALLTNEPNTKRRKVFKEPIPHHEHVPEVKVTITPKTPSQPTIKVGHGDVDVNDDEIKKMAKDFADYVTNVTSTSLHDNNHAKIKKLRVVKNMLQKSVGACDTVLADNLPGPICFKDPYELESMHNCDVDIFDKMKMHVSSFNNNNLTFLEFMRTIRHLAPIENLAPIISYFGESISHLIEMEKIEENVQ